MELPPCKAVRGLGASQTFFSHIMCWVARDSEFLHAVVDRVMSLVCSGNRRIADKILGYALKCEDQTGGFREQAGPFVSIGGITGKIESRQVRSGWERHSSEMNGTHRSSWAGSARLGAAQS